MLQYFISNEIDKSKKFLNCILVWFPLWYARAACLARFKKKNKGKHRAKIRVNMALKSHYRTLLNFVSGRWVDGWKPKLIKWKNVDKFTTPYFYTKINLLEAPKRLVLRHLCWFVKSNSFKLTKMFPFLTFFSTEKKKKESVS